ncbi:MAG: hypothetical protein HYX75_02215 [Acidobacteria bacterium]|nr:hypothetical protein [Acidobacteriota bacterium]
MDAARALEKIRAVLDKDRLVPTLPEMTHTPVRTIEPARVAPIDLADEGPRAAPRRLAKEVIVIRRESESVHDHAAVFDNPPDSFEEVSSITIVQKDRHLGDPARHHMVGRWPRRAPPAPSGSCEKRISTDPCFST